MGEYAEIQWRRDAARGIRYSGDGERKRNPIVRHCPICGKGTRSEKGNPEAGLREHMRVKHPAPKGGE